MKYVTLLILTITLSLTAFSKPGTDSSTIKLPYRVAKQVAIDLNTFDSLKNAYDVTKSMLDLTTKKSLYQDSVIKSCDSNNILLTNTVNTFKSLDSASQIKIQSLESKNIKLEKRGKVYGIAAISGWVLFIISVLVK